MAKMYLDNLPKYESGTHKGKIKWRECIGYEVKAEANGEVHYIKILKVEVDISGRAKLYIEVDGTAMEKPIGCNEFKNGQLKNYLEIKKSIWEEARWMCDLGLSEEDAKKYTKMSGQKVNIVCPLCGRVKEGVRIANMCRRKSISCVCDDKRSFPEKVMYCVLEQLGEEFSTRYRPKYLKLNGSQKESDFYIPRIKLVIETDGGLGHEGGAVYSNSKKELKDCVEVDKWKDEQHTLNGVETIRVDCRESNINYIKDSILNSKLSAYFNLSKIDWRKCEEFALKNVHKEICDFFNKGIKNIEDLAKDYKLAQSTIRKILDKGNELGWCNYNGKEIRNKKICESLGKEVMVYKNGEFKGKYPSVGELW